MLQQFQNYIKAHNLFLKKDKLLLAISGGKDSVLLAHLLKQSGFNFSLAHCNFKLRDKESNDDEKFCIDLAKKLNVELFCKSFDTRKYAKQNKLSIQMAARELRYNWFNELLKINSFDYLLTAHHATDNVETVLINLLRGTGLKGLTGISLKNEEQKIIRPLLFFSSEEITKVVKDLKLKYREDSSNKEDKYQRNFLRLKVLPNLKKIQPQLEAVMLENSRVLLSDYKKLKTLNVHLKEDLLQKKQNGFSIELKKLEAIGYSENTLYNLLKAFNFSKTQIKNLALTLKGNDRVGKTFKSKTHNLIIDRNTIEIIEKKTEASTINKFKSIKDLINFPKFALSRPKKFIVPKKNELLINEGKLKFPLLMRNVKTGDKFKPFGMYGFKLISDFLREQKINALQKKEVCVLVNGNNEIIWVIGLRSDERYKVNANETNLILLKIEH